MAKFFRVSCKCPSVTERRGRSNYLGSIQLDTPNTAHFHCKSCNTTWQYRVTEDQSVISSKVINEIVYTDAPAVVSEG